MRNAFITGRNQNLGDIKPGARSIMLQVRSVACVSAWGSGDGRCSFVGRAGRWAWPGLLGSAGGERLQQGVVGDKLMLRMRLGVSAALHVGARQLPMHVQPCQEEQHQLEVTLAGQHTHRGSSKPWP